MLGSATSHKGHTGYFLPSGYTNKVVSMRAKPVNYTDYHVYLEDKKPEFFTLFEIDISRLCLHTYI